MDTFTNSEDPDECRIILENYNLTTLEMDYPNFIIKPEG